MKSYMDLDEDPVIPDLIEEVLDFKEFVKPYISDDTLIGHTKGRQFLFYRGENGNPLMQYKLASKRRYTVVESRFRGFGADSHWSSKGGHDAPHERTQ
jgi:hypothetical protein